MGLKLTDRLLNLVYPPICVSCKEALPFDSTDALCPLCQSRYQLEKGYICPECASWHGACRCTPPLMKRYAGESFHLIEYVKGESAAREMILYAKDECYEYLFRFLSAEIASLVRARVARFDECLITFVPRSEKKLVVHGVDQAKETAKRVAKLLGIPFVSLLMHAESEDQKKLNLKDRAKNAEYAFSLVDKPKMSVNGKRVILYDDVVTSGSTMAACASQLKKAGAKEIVFVSFGKTYRRKKEGQRALPPSRKQFRSVKKMPF